MRHRLLAFAALLFAALAPGCAREGAIRGTVLYDGRPLEKGWITFYPAGPQGASRGAEIVAGEYRLEHLPCGKMRVRLTGARRAEVVKTGGRKRVRLLRDRESLPDNLPGSDQFVEVTGGAQTLDFDLKKTR